MDKEIINKVLVDSFGLVSFRHGQEEIVEAVLNGQQVIVVMPTGSGKSLTFQLPAILTEGTTVVVSPLISLMKDQVEGLQEIGISATFINSSLPNAEVRARLEEMKAGVFKLVYIAPERFRSEAFVRALIYTNIKLFVVDEFHTISTWGHDFRPDYRKLHQAIQACGNPQVIALTATATKKVRIDAAQQLGLIGDRSPIEFVYGFDRPNLCLSVQETVTINDKFSTLKAFLDNHKDDCGIIYTTTRKVAEYVQDRLHREGYPAVVYHAGLKDEQRSAAQDEFMTNPGRILVATSAFGMGIDKPDVRFVVHYQIPKSVEAYYQEIGRAGRDGMPADCLLLFNQGDVNVQEFFIDGNYPTPETVEDVYETIVRLQADRRNIDFVAIEGNMSSRSNTMAIETCVKKLEQAGHVKRLIDPSTKISSLIVPDTTVAKLRIDEEELRRRRNEEWDKLKDIINFSSSVGCLRREVLLYFGETPKYSNCGACSNCIRQSVIDSYTQEEREESSKKFITLGKSGLNSRELRGTVGAYSRKRRTMGY